MPPWLQDDKTDIAREFASIKEYSSGEDKSDASFYARRAESIRAETPTENGILQKDFLMAMSDLDLDGTWTRAYEEGEPYREFARSTHFFLTFWGRHARGRWVESALRWSKKHPGEPTPGNLEFRYTDIKNEWVHYPYIPKNVEKT